VQGIDLAEVSTFRSGFEQRRNFQKHRPEIFFRNSLQARRIATRAQKLCLHDARIQGIRCDVIKMSANVAGKFFPWRQLLRQRVVDGGAHSAKHLVEHGAVHGFFVFEVVVEQGLVHAGGTRDGVGAGAGHPFLGKFTDGRFQDGGAAFFGAAAGAKADCAGSVHN
jgi:hypothetical protein